MTWAQRLKRVFKIGIETCELCGSVVKISRSCASCARGICASLHIIASIEQPAVIEKILAHLRRRDSVSSTPQLPRAPPIAT